jgi:hypothetical protein
VAAPNVAPPVPTPPDRSSRQRNRAPSRASAVVSRPSPSQSPTSGRSPGAPNTGAASTTGSGCAPAAEAAHRRGDGQREPPVAGAAGVVGPVAVPVAHHRGAVAGPGEPPVGEAAGGREPLVPDRAADDAEAVRRAGAEATGDRHVAGPPEGHLAVRDAAGRRVAEEPAAGAEHGQPVAAVAVPVARDGDVAADAEPEPDRPVADPDRRHAVVVPAGIAGPVAVPVAGQRLQRLSRPAAAAARRPGRWRRRSPATAARAASAPPTRCR